MMLIMPSVTRNEGMRTFVVSRPLTRPTRRPTARAPHGDDEVRLAQQHGHDQAESATIEPMDRSISPAESTKVMPKAMIETIAVCRAMLAKLSGVRKPRSLRVTAKKTRMARKPT